MKTKKMILAAIFAAMTAIGAFIKVPMGITSVTLQFLFTALAGVLLGPGWGAISQGVYVAIGLLGVPVFTMGGGFSYVLQPSFGFLLGLIPAAAVIGAITRKSKTIPMTALGCVVGLGVLYAVGVPYMYLILNVYMAKGVDIWYVVKNGMLLYLPGDALKILIVSLLGPQIRRRLGL